MSRRTCFYWTAAVLAAAAIAAFQGCGPGLSEREASMDRIAESYVRLALALGEHDPMYVDAYYGPAEWKDEASTAKKTLEEIAAEASGLADRLRTLDLEGSDDIVLGRRVFLEKHLDALATWAKMKSGLKLSFDEEVRALYDVDVPRYDEEFFEGTLEKIEEIVPGGDGSLLERLDRYKQDFIIPAEKVPEVFATVIEEARKRTAAHIGLPEGESFDVEYVTGTSWGAYNWYKGDARSLIQVNTDLPTFIDSPLGLAAHEGYPGHHVYNALLEERLTKGRGWVEFSIYPLFSPMSLLAEGTANYGIEMAFPGGERLEYERSVLYPIAGMDPARAADYSRLVKLTRELSKARMEAARGYLDGRMTREQAVDYMGRNALISRDRASKLVDFFDEFRSYIINYYVGYDLVKAYMEKEGGEGAVTDEKWAVFEDLLSTPVVPSGL